MVGSGADARSSKKKQAWRVSRRTKFRLFFAHSQTSQNFCISDWPVFAKLFLLVAKKLAGQSNCFLNRPFFVIGPMPTRFTPGFFFCKEIKAQLICFLPMRFGSCTQAKTAATPEAGAHDSLSSLKSKFHGHNKMVLQYLVKSDKKHR